MADPTQTHGIVAQLTNQEARPKRVTRTTIADPLV